MLAARRPASPELRLRSTSAAAAQAGSPGEAPASDSKLSASVSSGSSASSQLPPRLSRSLGLPRQRHTAVVRSKANIRRETNAAHENAEATRTGVHKDSGRQPHNRALGSDAHRQLERQRAYYNTTDVRRARLAHRPPLQPGARRQPGVNTASDASSRRPAAKATAAQPRIRRVAVLAGPGSAPHAHAQVGHGRADDAVVRAASRLRQAKAQERARAEAERKEETATREREMHAQREKAQEAEERAAAVRKMRVEAEAAERERQARGQTRWGGDLEQPAKPGRDFRSEEEKKRLQVVMREQRQRRKVRVVADSERVWLFFSRCPASISGFAPALLFCTSATHTCLTSSLLIPDAGEARGGGKCPRSRGCRP